MHQIKKLDDVGVALNDLLTAAQAQSQGNNTPLHVVKFRKKIRNKQPISFQSDLLRQVNFDVQNQMATVFKNYNDEVAEYERLRRAFHVSYSEHEAGCHDFLEQLTTNDGFAKALVVSGADWPRWKRKIKKNNGQSSKKIRKLERTLLKYLLRSVGRPTPFGLWAGTADVEVNAQQQVPIKFTSSQERFEFQPRVESLIQALETYISVHEIWGQLCICLNPTVHCGNSDVLWIDRRRGTTQVFKKDSDPVLAEAINELRKRTRKKTSGKEQRFYCDDFKKHSYLNGIDGHTIQNCIKMGLFELNLDALFPSGSFWEHAQNLGRVLTGIHRKNWISVCTRIEIICTELETACKNNPAKQFAAKYTDAEELIIDILGEFGSCDIAIANILHCNCEPPFRVKISDFMLERLENSISASIDYQNELGVAESFRKIYVRHLFNSNIGATTLKNAVFNYHRIMNETVYSESDMPEKICDQLSVEGIFEKSFDQHQILDDLPKIVTSLTASKIFPKLVKNEFTPIVYRSHTKLRRFCIGSALVRLIDQNDIVLQPICTLPHAGLFSNSRYSGHGDIAADIKLILHANSSSFQGDKVAPLFGSRAMNGNVIYDWVSEHNDNSPIDISSHHEISQLHVVWNFQRDPYEIYLLDIEANALFPLQLGRSKVVAQDPVSSFLFHICASSGWEFTGYGVPPTRNQVETGGRLPAVVCGESQARIVPRRWIIPSCTVHRLEAMTGEMRFLEWEKVCWNLDIPDLFYVKRSDWAERLLTLRDNSIALDIILRGTTRFNCGIVIEEFDGGFEMTREGEANHYVCEFGVSYCQLEGAANV